MSVRIIELEAVIFSGLVQSLHLYKLRQNGSEEVSWEDAIL